VRFDAAHEISFSRLYHGDDERAPVLGLHWGLRVLFEAVVEACSLGGSGPD
jgi:hypothetical protein